MECLEHGMYLDNNGQLEFFHHQQHGYSKLSCKGSRCLGLKWISDRDREFHFLQYGIRMNIRSCTIFITLPAVSLFNK